LSDGEVDYVEDPQDGDENDDDMIEQYMNQ